MKQCLNRYLISILAVLFSSVCTAQNFNEFVVCAFALPDGLAVKSAISDNPKSPLILLKWQMRGQDEEFTAGLAGGTDFSSVFTLNKNESSITSFSGQYQRAEDSKAFAYKVEKNLVTNRFSIRFSSVFDVASPPKLTNEADLNSLLKNSSPYLLFCRIANDSGETYSPDDTSIVKYKPVIDPNFGKQLNLNDELVGANKSYSSGVPGFNSMPGGSSSSSALTPTTPMLMPAELYYCAFKTNPEGDKIHYAAWLKEVVPQIHLNDPEYLKNKKRLHGISSQNVNTNIDIEKSTLNPDSVVLNNPEYSSLTFIKGSRLAVSRDRSMYPIPDEIQGVLDSLKVKIDKEIWSVTMKKGDVSQTAQALCYKSTISLAGGTKSELETIKKSIENNWVDSSKHVLSKEYTYYCAFKPDESKKTAEVHYISWSIPFDSNVTVSAVPPFEFIKPNGKDKTLIRLYDTRQVLKTDTDFIFTPYKKNPDKSDKKEANKKTYELDENKVSSEFQDLTTMMENDFILEALEKQIWIVNGSYKGNIEIINKPVLCYMVVKELNQPSTEIERMINKSWNYSPAVSSSGASSGSGGSSSRESDKTKFEHYTCTEPLDKGSKEQSLMSVNWKLTLDPLKPLSVAIYQGQTQINSDNDETHIVVNYSNSRGYISKISGVNKKSGNSWSLNFLAHLELPYEKWSVEWENSKTAMTKRLTCSKQGTIPWNLVETRRYAPQIFPANSIEFVFDSSQTSDMKRD